MSRTKNLVPINELPFIDSVTRSISGLTRHVTTMHLREPMPEEKEPTNEPKR